MVAYTLTRKLFLKSESQDLGPQERTLKTQDRHRVRTVGIISSTLYENVFLSTFSFLLFLNIFVPSCFLP